MLADGRAGLLESASGDMAGLDDYVLRDADAALDELERARLKAIFVLFDYHWFKRGRIVDGVRTGGRQHTRDQSGPAPPPDRPRGRSAARSLRPPSRNQRLGRCQRAGVGHEGHAAAPAPVRGAQGGHAGVHPRRRRRRPSTHLPCRNRRQRVGSNLAACRGPRPGCLPGALVRPTREERPGSMGRVALLGLDRPLILGEFPTKGSRRTPAAIFELCRTPAMRARSPGRRWPTTRRPTPAASRAVCGPPP